MFAAVSAHFECCGQTLRLYSSPRHPLQSQQESWALTHGMSASMIPPTDRQKRESTQSSMDAETLAKGHFEKNDLSRAS